MSKIKVLLAEDHGLVRKGLLALLDGVADIQVVAEASDGREAVKLAADLLPDVVVMDISMPTLNGLEATQKIRRRHPEVKVVILTMYSNEEYILRTFQSGAACYVLKTSAPAELVSAIRAAYFGSTYLSPSISKKLILDFLEHGEAEGADDSLSRLTNREREILQLIAEGHSIREIADILYLSPKTVRAHRAKLMKKLEVRSTASLTLFALRHGVISLDY